MRFIIGLIFFALLFYSIWYFFPETFQTLLQWTADVFNYLKGLVESLTHKTSGASPIPETPSPTG